MIYLERIVEFPVSFSLMDFNQITTIFSDDPEALFILAKNMDDYSNTIINEKITAKNLAIENYKKILSIWTKDINPKGNALINQELGILYSGLANYLEKSKNCDLALECFANSHSYFTKNEFPFNFHYINYLQSIIYDAYASIINPIEFAKKSLESARIANSFFTKTKYPYFFALTLNIVSNALLRFAEFDQAKLPYYCKEAIKNLNKSLEILNINDYPKDYSMIKNNIGSAYGYLANYENVVENSEMSISAYFDALIVRTKDKYPLAFATTNNNLGTTYDFLAQYYEEKMNFDKSFECFEKAIQSYNEALIIRTQKALPILYASTKLNLHLSYLHYSFTIFRRIFRDRTYLLEYRKKSNNIGLDYLNLAIEGLNDVLDIYDIDNYPYQYSLVHTNLGNAYSALSEQLKDPVKNCRKSINSYNEALKIRTINNYPCEYGEIQINLGIAFLVSARFSNHIGNCNKAFESLNKALKVFNPKKFPRQYSFVLEKIEEVREFCQKYMVF